MRRSIPASLDTPARASTAPIMNAGMPARRKSGPRGGRSGRLESVWRIMKASPAVRRGGPLRGS
jgi:hypothetical protein